MKDKAASLQSLLATCSPCSRHICRTRRAAGGARASAYVSIRQHTWEAGTFVAQDALRQRRARYVSAASSTYATRALKEAVGEAMSMGGGAVTLWRGGRLILRRRARDKSVRLQARMQQVARGLRRQHTSAYVRICRQHTQRMLMQCGFKNVRLQRQHTLTYVYVKGYGVCGGLMRVTRHRIR
jgi:hypothetical protein